VPFFFSDQYDLGMEYFGLHDPGDRLVMRGSLDAGSFQAFWVGGDGNVSAGMHANDWDASEDIARLVEAGEPGPAALSAAGPRLPSELPPVA
jgi:3-phenylpropionate/trans-cinnamate dioxygenase ferredoxin reductase subunit